MTTEGQATTAERVRASRLRKKRAAGLTLGPTDAAWLAVYEASHGRATTATVPDSPEPAPAPAPSPDEPAHAQTTEPFEDVIAPDAHTWVPTSAPVEPSATEGQEGQGAAPPVVADVVEEPPPPLSDEDVSGVAMAVLGFWKLGLAMLMHKNPDIANLVSALPPALRDALPKADALVYGSAVRVAKKRGLRVPYQDELVVAGALGIAAFGVFGPDATAQPPGDAGEEESR